MTKPDKDLDRALTAAEENKDPAIADLVMLADDLERELAGNPPLATRDRALFIEGVAARKRSMWSSLTVPAFAVIALLAFLALSGRAAMPGDTLYPVRKVLHSAGLASAPIEEVTRHLEQAELLLANAEGAYSAGSPQVAARYGTSALKVLGQAEEDMRDLAAADRQRLGRRIEDMTLRAVTFIRLGVDDSGSDDSGSDNSGSGSDDSDNSGSGSDDSDNSGSGSDDSDNSGSGSDDSGGDNSGSGSDNSGSGSGDDREDVLDDRRDAMEDRRDG